MADVMGFERDDFELDLPPEFCQYRDEGCEVAASCLRCPLPACIYDEYAGKNRRMKKLRAREMGKLFSKGMGTRDIAEEFGVTQRTVQRAVRRGKRKPLCHPDSERSEEEGYRGRAVNFTTPPRDSSSSA